MESKDFLIRLLRKRLCKKVVFEVRTDGAEGTRYLKVCSYQGTEQGF